MIENPRPTARLRAKVLATTVAAMLSGAMLFGASVAVAADTDPIAGARGDYDAAAGTYTVGAGDNLSAIAKRFGMSVGELETANDLRSDDIAVGQELKVAAADAGAGAGGASGDKPNILFIMGDDIGIMNVGAYHQGLMVGETPNIDRIANEGARFMTYYAEQSCTAGRTAFFTGMHPLRAGMVMPQLPGATSSLLPGTPALAKFLLDLGYNTGEFGKNHLGDKAASLPTAHGFQEFWGYLYHLDAMQGVSFPDINKTPTDQTVVPPCKNTPVKGLAEVARCRGSDRPRSV